MKKASRKIKEIVKRIFKKEEPEKTLEEQQQEISEKIIKILKDRKPKNSPLKKKNI